MQGSAPSEEGAGGSLGCLLFVLMIPLVILFGLPWLMLGAVGDRGMSHNGTLPSPPAVAPADLAYVPVAEDRLLAYLLTKHSALATPERVHTLVEAAQQYKINPLLLIAITGQEQSFVPVTDAQAEQEAANPFNVFGCWCWVSPGLGPSAAYAADTVVRLLRTPPPAGFSAIHWLNTPENPAGEYATDPNWWIGVSFYFEELQRWPGINPPAADRSGAALTP